MGAGLCRLLLCCCVLHAEGCCWGGGLGGLTAACHRVLSFALSNVSEASQAPWPLPPSPKEIPNKIISFKSVYSHVCKLLDNVWVFGWGDLGHTHHAQELISSVLCSGGSPSNALREDVQCWGSHSGFWMQNKCSVCHSFSSLGLMVT